MLAGLRTDGPVSIDLSVPIWTIEHVAAAPTAARGTATATVARTAPRPADAGSLVRGVLARITCKGGPELLRAALAAGVVGELDLTIAAALAGSGIRLVGDALLPELVRLLLTQGARRRAPCSPAAHFRRLIAGTAMAAIRPAGALPA